MTIGQNPSARIAYKAYSTGVITSNSQPTSSSDPAATGGQILRRTTSTLNLTKDTYQSNEIVGHRQIADFRHGTKRAVGSLNGELSPGTYFDFIEAACRGTKVASISKSNTEFTSVAADNATSKFTFGGGAPVTEGMRVGMVLQFSNLSEALNNGTNYLITGFGGISNREVSVYPAPTDMGADSAFTVVSVGKRVIVPSSSHVDRKFAVEVYHSDLDMYRMFTECRVGGINLALPATGLATIEVPMMGRDMETASGGSAPFFGSPTAATTTGLLAAVNGLLRVGGSNIGVITGGQINMNLSPSSDAVVGQDFVPEINLGRAVVTGQLSAFLEDLTLINAFKNETEIEILFYLKAASGVAPDFMTVYLPKNKFGDAQVGLEGENGIPITIPFQSLLYGGTEASTGIPATTIQFVDSQAP